MLAKTAKILIIGFGSIGQRHYTNVKKMGFQNISVYDTDTGKMKGREIVTIGYLSLSALRQFDIAFVCNPTSLHIQTALLCARAKCHVFIEKPLSHTLRGLKELQKICAEKKLIVMVGCNMRFHPCLKFVKRYLEKKKLGKVYSIRLEFGSWLPFWRPLQDYRKNYAAKKSMGGGIILDDIHEFDLLFWLNGFAQVVRSQFLFDKISNLEIETEDMCIAAFEFANKVFGQVSCDYLQQNYTRTCKVIGERGNVEWNWHENVVWLKTHAGSHKLFEAQDWDVNIMYTDEIRYFLDCVSKKRETLNGLQTARSVLQHCIQR